MNGRKNSLSLISATISLLIAAMIVYTDSPISSIINDRKSGSYIFLVAFTLILYIYLWRLFKMKVLLLFAALSFAFIVLLYIIDAPVGVLVFLFCSVGLGTGILMIVTRRQYNSFTLFDAKLDDTEYEDRSNDSQESQEKTDSQSSIED